MPGGRGISQGSSLDHCLEENPDRRPIPKGRVATSLSEAREASTFRDNLRGQVVGMCPELQRLDAMQFVRPTHDSTNRLCREAVPTSRPRQHVPDVAAFAERDRHRSEIDVIPSGNRKGSLMRLSPGPVYGRDKSARVLLPVRGRHLRHETRNVGVLAREDDRRHILETRSTQDETLGPDLQHRADCRTAYGRSDHDPDMDERPCAVGPVGVGEGVAVVGCGGVGPELRRLLVRVGRLPAGT